jgi:hypothetical protein
MFTIYNGNELNSATLDVDFIKLGTVVDTLDLIYWQSTAVAVLKDAVNAYFV